MFHMRTALFLPYCLARGAALRHGDFQSPAQHTVDLELPPVERWKTIIAEFGPGIIEAVKGWKARLDLRLPSTAQQSWVFEFRTRCPNEYLQELTGIHAELQAFPGASDLYLSSLMLYQLSHELEEGSRAAAGAEVLAVGVDGTAVHAARREHPKDAKTIMMKFARLWKVGFIGQVELGSIGLVAGFKPRGWSFAVRARDVGEEDQPAKQLERLKAGALPMMVMSRQVLEQNGNYDDVVAMVREPRLMRAAYFSFGGNGPYEGAVVSRSAEPAFRRIEEIKSVGNGDGWYVVQATGDWFLPKYGNATRDAGIRALQKRRGLDVGVDFVAAAAAKADDARSQTSLLVMVPRYSRFCPALNATDQKWISRYCRTIW